MENTYICSDCSDSFKKGWATIKRDDEIHTFCCFVCYQSNPIIVPTKAVFTLTDEPVLVPMKHIRQKETFKFLTDIEINELTDEEYNEYTNGVDEQFILNPIQSEVYHTGIQNDRHAQLLEDEFNDDSSDEGSHDDY